MNFPPEIPLRYDPLQPLMLALYDAAEKGLRAAMQAAEKPKVIRGKGVTRRPGSGTPLWNEVVKAAQPFLKKRGTKVRLARLLGVPRQRITEYFTQGTSYPDAERLLLILCWLAAAKEGREFFPEPVTGT